MKQATITAVSSCINWDTIPTLPISELVKTAATDVRAYAQICYDASALFLRLTACEQEIRAVERGPLGTPCEDSCLEFFFSPIEGDSRYFNFEFNSNACLYLGMGSNIRDLVRFVFEEEAAPEELFRPAVEMLPEGWRITYQIPYDFIRRYFPDFTVFPGKTIRANFYKCSDLCSKPHYLAWNPIKRQGTGVFHTPEEFGLLCFEKPAE